MKTIKVAFVSAALAIVTSSANADASCSVIQNDSARLKCYDEKYHVADASEASNQSDWRIERDENALTGRTDIFISVDARETIQCGYQATRPTLYLRCMDNTTAALLVTDCFMADIQGYGRVRYRVDSGAMKARSFIERTDNMALGLWSFGRSRPFISDLEGKEQLIMEFTPYNDIPKQSVFDISGLSEALIPLREECGW